MLQDPKLCFSGEKLWEAFHGTAESVSKLFDGTPTHSRVRAVKLMHDILLLLTSPASLKGSALGKPASKVSQKLASLLTCSASTVPEKDTALSGDPRLAWSHRQECIICGRCGGTYASVDCTFLVP